MKNKCIIGFIVVCMLCIFTGCSDKKDEIHFFPEDVFLVQEGYLDEITFSVNYVYKGKRPEISLEGLIGDGIENVTYESGELSEKNFSDKKYGGYRVGIFYVNINTTGLSENEKISIDALKIKCNEVDKELYFQKELLFTKTAEVKPLPIKGSLVPVKSVIRDMDHPETYQFTAKESFTVTEFKTSELLTIKEMNIYFNNEIVEEFNESNPIHLNKKDEILFKVVYDFNDENRYANIYTTTIISGFDNENELVQKNVQTYFCGLNDEKDKRDFIDAYLAE